VAERKYSDTNCWDFGDHRCGYGRPEMMLAIRAAAQPSALFKGSSLSNGLRCIRTFERVNEVRFDPFNEQHIAAVRGMGVHEELFRKVRLRG